MRAARAHRAYERRTSEVRVSHGVVRMQTGEVEAKVPDCVGLDWPSAGLLRSETLGGLGAKARRGLSFRGLRRTTAVRPANAGQPVGFCTLPEDVTWAARIRGP